MSGGANPQLMGLYKLVVEEYGSIINSPINDPELQTYLIQYIDNLQFLIADPVNLDTIQFKEVSQQLLDRINFLNENQYEGQKGGVGDDKRGFFSKVGDNVAGPTMRALGLGPYMDYDEDYEGNPMFIGSHESENIDSSDGDGDGDGDEVIQPTTYSPSDKMLNNIEKVDKKDEEHDDNQVKPMDIVTEQELKEEREQIEKEEKEKLIDKFINSNNLLELENMLTSGLITNVDLRDSKGYRSIENAQAINNIEKVYYLLSKGANINIANKESKPLLYKAVMSPNDNVQLISNLIRLGARKSGIDKLKIPNEINRKAFTETNYTLEDSKKLTTELEEHIDSLLQKKAINPLYAQWKKIQESKKERDNDFKKWGDEMQKLLKETTDTVDEITKIKKSIPKYEEQKKEIEKATNKQLKLLKAQTKSCIDAFTKQTQQLNLELLKHKKLTIKLKKELKLERNKEISAINANIALDKDDAICTSKQKKNFDLEIKESIDSSNIVLDTSSQKVLPLSRHEIFVRDYINTNYVKKNLYEFMNQCRLLDSVPSWRAKISTIMVGYLTSYAIDPNDKSKHTSVIPSYEIFNLVLQGTPGVGKSYSSAIIGKALKWCGFLTIGKMKEIKKPDIVGSYTGQTAPKVYNELTQGLGNVVFIDEAYSIAGAKDQVKGTFNEFGQEALDAITDYTSEHIGLLAFIVAGYEYEMQNQFLNVNIGLPRRFPTVLTLRRYDMKSFWKILEMPIIKFCPKYQVNHQHHACFELLNIMFNFQWTPNPVLQISKKWPEWWEGDNLKNLIMNLKVNMLSNGEEIINIPFAKLSNFDKKIKNIGKTNITATSIDVLPLTELIGGDINMETATFVKAYFIYKFCNINNGDFFRSQADNLTKFAQRMLQDKIENPSNLFVPDQDNNKVGGNTKWIEYIYFNLYFKENPNKSVDNINFSYKDPTGEPASEQSTESESTEESTPGMVLSKQRLQARLDENKIKPDEKGGSKIKQYTKKNIRAKKYTRRNHGKKNKNTIHKYKNKKHKKTIRQRGGDQESYNKLLVIVNKIQDYFNEIKKDDYKAIDGKRGIQFPSPYPVLSLFTRVAPGGTWVITEEVKDDIDKLTITELDTILDKITTIKKECQDAISASDKSQRFNAEPYEFALRKIIELYNYIYILRPNTPIFDAKAKAKTDSEVNTNVDPLAPPIDSANTPVPNSLSPEADVAKDISTTSSPIDSPNTPTETKPPIETKPPVEAKPPIETKPPIPNIIQTKNLPNEIKDDFLTVLNYYLEPSISESDLNTAYKNIIEKLKNLGIDELEYIYILTSLRIKQLEDQYFKSNPSKNSGLNIKNLNVIRSAVNKTLTTRDKTVNFDKLIQEADEMFISSKVIGNDLRTANEYAATKALPEFMKKLELKENLNVEENVPLQKEYIDMKKEKKIQDIENQKQEFEKQQQEIIKTQLAQEKVIKNQELAEKQIFQNESDMKNLVEQMNRNKIDKDLVFDIVGIDFSAFRDAQEITETIVRNKMIYNEINNNKGANEKLKTIFVTFMKKYNEYLTIFEKNADMEQKQKTDLPIFIYTYLLLACYNISFIESTKPLTKFNVDSWWFFTADDFNKISDYLDVEIIIDNFNKLIGVEPKDTQKNENIEKVEEIVQSVAQGVEKKEVDKIVENIEEQKMSDKSKSP